ncbi:uncharacterized protein LOC123545124 isoform X3 [Mercenaria mercenaria]|uniref:uncharacterized protein LOC123545124 isoform X3 n=1 Tax=Mercenaria mercenaria TaxID=6596 RepID=UPI00234E66CE|nr:uncharacterized protein LOC123545124 isoform X3 [Mercenaria mercenaria]
MAGNLTEKEIIELKDAFAILDKNNDGFIKKAEVKDILISSGKDGSNEEVKRVIAEFDTDGDGMINFAEFLNVMAKNYTNSAMESGGSLQHMFKIFDRDNDGFITRSEMKRALGLIPTFGHHLSLHPV